MVKKIVIKIK